MNKTEHKLTFGTVSSMHIHRQQLERKLDGIRADLAGRSQPLLPKGWNDEDAWQLARELSSLMAQVYNLQKTVFDENNPYPENDTLIEEICYYNPYFQDENPFQPPELPQALWTEVLHCGILIAASSPSFCFLSSGTFDDLEKLFLGTLRSGAGPILQFRPIMDHVESALADGRLKHLEGFGFGPTPPVFDPPQDTEERSHQDAIEAYWEEWDWLNRFPCGSELRASIQALRADGNDSKMQNFIEYYIGLEDLLRQAVDLYLYQKGVSGMLENRYYAVYALLNGVQKELKALEAEVAKQEAAGTGWDLDFDPVMEEEGSDVEKGG